MNSISEKQVQVLRTMDKCDKIGREGVIELLQKPPADFGADLDPIQAGLIGLFLDTSGTTNEETLKNIKGFFVRAGHVRARIDLMLALDQHVISADGTTAWDRLLSMSVNADETWARGRPKNIGWALDDLLSVISTLKSE